tara:strand:- start:118851 stop:119732 length:882 start_codon:yes stop_codon:yes gene_type:complete
VEHYPTTNRIPVNKYVLLFLYIFVIQIGLFGQQFANGFPALLNQQPFFNDTLIQKKGIHQITTSVMYKSPNEKIVFSAETAVFIFNKIGKVEKWEHTNRSGVLSSSQYYFSNKGYLATEHIISSNSNILKSYIYDENGMITAIQKADATTAKTIQEDKFSYDVFSKFQYKKYWLNNENLTYKYTLVDVDKEGRKKEERTRFIRGASRETTYYTYHNGWLVSYAHNIKETTRREVKYQLEYSKNGNLLTMNESIDGAQVTHYEYLYEGGLLIAILQKNINSQRIKITKFKYLFF